MVFEDTGTRAVTKRAMGAEISLEDTPGGGLTVVVVIPVEPDEPVESDGTAPLLDASVESL